MVNNKLQVINLIEENQSSSEALTPMCWRRKMEQLIEY